MWTIHIWINSFCNCFLFIIIVFCFLPPLLSFLRFYLSIFYDSILSPIFAYQLSFYFLKISDFPWNNPNPSFNEHYVASHVVQVTSKRHVQFFPSIPFNLAVINFTYLYTLIILLLPTNNFLFGSTKNKKTKNKYFPFNYFFFGDIFIQVLKVSFSSS